MLCQSTVVKRVLNLKAVDVLIYTFLSSPLINWQTYSLQTESWCLTACFRTVESSGLQAHCLPWLGSCMQMRPDSPGIYQMQNPCRMSLRGHPSHFGDSRTSRRSLALQGGNVMVLITVTTGNKESQFYFS